MTASWVIGGAYMSERAGGVPTRHPRPTNPRTHKHTQANTNTLTSRATRLNHCKRGAYNEYTGVCVCVCACVFVYAWVRTPWVPRWHPSGAFLIDRFATRPAVRVRAAFRCLVPCSCVYPREGPVRARLPKLGHAFPHPRFACPLTHTPTANLGVSTGVNDCC